MNSSNLINYVSETEYVPENEMSNRLGINLHILRNDSLEKQKALLDGFSTQTLNELSKVNSETGRLAKDILNINKRVFDRTGLDVSVITRFRDEDQKRVFEAISIAKLIEISAIESRTGRLAKTILLERTKGL